MVKDIEGTKLQVGDVVYYARKRDYHASGELVLTTITKIHENGKVSMNKYISTDPETQIIKKK